MVGSLIAESRAARYHSSASTDLKMRLRADMARMRTVKAGAR